MKLGFMSDISLTIARDTFLLDCKAVELSAQTRRAYRKILTTFIAFTGDITVKELTPGHVRMYIASLAEARERHWLVKHYAVIRTWIRWLYAQKLATERVSLVKAPRKWGAWFLTSETKNRHQASERRF